jgi:hypothetical protein
VHILVMADACTDQTVDAASAGQAQVISISARNVGMARAAGVQELLRRMAGTDPAAVWLATTDADSLVPGDWLRRQLAYANQQWDVVLGTVTVADWEDHPAHVTAVYQALYEFSTCCTEPANSCSGCPIPGAASFWRTSVWTMTRSGNCRGLRSPGKPNWEPNWLPTATVTQLHPATPGRIAPGQNAHPASPSHAKTSPDTQTGSSAIRLKGGLQRSRIGRSTEQCANRRVRMLGAG